MVTTYLKNLALICSIFLSTNAFAVQYCKTVGVPSNYIIVGQMTTVSCGSGTNNAWDARLPKPKGDVMCADTPYQKPSEYIIFAESNNGIQCPNSKIWEIRVPKDIDQMCSKIPYYGVPSGYILTGSTQSPKCPGYMSNPIYDGNVWNIKKN